MSLETTVRAAQDAETIVFSIGLLSDEERREASKAKRALMTLTEAIGGQSLLSQGRYAKWTKSLIRSLAILRNQYTIAYSPVNSALDGTYRQVKVIATGYEPTPWFVRKLAITPVSRNRRRLIDAQRDLEIDSQGLSADAVAKPIFALAIRNLYGDSCRDAGFCAVLRCFVAIPQGLSAVSALGRADVGLKVRSAELAARGVCGNCFFAARAGLCGRDRCRRGLLLINAFVIM